MHLSTNKNMLRYCWLHQTTIWKLACKLEKIITTEGSPPLVFGNALESSKNTFKNYSALIFTKIRFDNTSMEFLMKRTVIGFGMGYPKDIEKTELYQICGKMSKNAFNMVMVRMQNWIFWANETIIPYFWRFRNYKLFFRNL